MTLLHTTNRNNTIELHTENYAGQNKNWFVLMYLFWLVFLRHNDEIMLLDMVSVHIKNILDCSSGHIKRLLKMHYVRRSFEMMKNTELSSKITTSVPSIIVFRRKRKEFLSIFFQFPSGFSIANYHGILFRRSMLRNTLTEIFPYSTDTEKFHLLRA